MTSDWKEAAEKYAVEQTGEKSLTEYGQAMVYLFTKNAFQAGAEHGYEDGYDDGLLKGSEVGDATAKRALKERDLDMECLQKERIEFVRERDKLKAEVERLRAPHSKDCAFLLNGNKPGRWDCDCDASDLEREREANAKLKAELTEAQGYIEGQDKEIIRLKAEVELQIDDRHKLQKELNAMENEHFNETNKLKRALEREREAVGKLVEKILGLCGEDSRALVLEAKSAVLRFQALLAAKQGETN